MTFQQFVLPYEISLYVCIQYQLKSIFYNFLFKNYVIMNRLENLQGQVKEKFIYTTDDGCLTLQQRRFYQENGYLVIKNFLTDDDIQKWTKRFLEYCDKKVEPLPGMQIVRDIALAKKGKLFGQSSITKLQDFQYDQELYTYCNNPKLIPYLRSFCGPNVKSVHTMFINKPPNMGGSSRHPFHQDLAYFPFRPANRIVAAWASLEDATKQNGSLNVFPKTHKGEFLQHSYPEWEGKVNKAYFGIKDYDGLKHMRVDLEMKKGDIVLFHPLLIHGSGQNKTQGYRKSFCCHFADASCKYIDIKGTFHQNVANEIMSYASKKFFQGTTDMTFIDIWKRKSRLITGQLDPNGI